MQSEGSMDGYSRDKFPHWSNQGDGCNTRLLEHDSCKTSCSAHGAKRGGYPTLHLLVRSVDGGSLGELKHRIVFTSSSTVDPMTKTYWFVNEKYKGPFSGDSIL